MNVAPFARGRGLVSTFIRHPNAANLLMVLMVVFGAFALARIDTQFFPTVETSTVSISIPWSGASAEDVETNILALTEPAVRYLDGVKEMNSYAREGAASITLTFVEGHDMQKAVADVETAVKALATLPEEAEDATITRSRWFDRIASASISGDIPEEDLRFWGKKIRDDLLARGVDRVTFTGLRDPELQVSVPERELRRLGITVEDVGQAIRSNSRDRPSGNLQGRIDRQLRTLADVESPRSLGLVEVKSFAGGEKVLLSDIARIRAGFEDGGVRGLSRSGGAIELDIMRSDQTDTLTANRILQDYIAELRPQLPDGLELQIYEVRADALGERIMLLVKNGMGGLVLVVIVLFIFLNARIAFWVAAGIPVALLATIGLMYVSGQSINMISLFALIMMLGVIVDDAIVVGEHTDTRLRLGEDPVTAAENGVGHMLIPVTAAVTTTIATFSPILLVTGHIGQIMGAMPFVVIAVALASLIECFLILPGHLSHSMNGRRGLRWSYWRQFIVALILTTFAVAFVTRAGGEGGALAGLPLLAELDAWRQSLTPFAASLAVAAGALVLATVIEALFYALAAFGRSRGDSDEQESWFRRRFDRGFDRFRNGLFNALVTLSFRWRYVTVAIAVGLVLIFARGLYGGGHVGFVFFPSPESENIRGSVIFNAGIPEDDAVAALNRIEDALWQADEELRGEGPSLIRATFATLGSSGRQQGDNLGRIKVQLTTSEERTVRTPDIVRAWRRAAPQIPGVQRFSIQQTRGGPPGADIDVELKGTSIGVLKQAAAEVVPLVGAIRGVSGVEDDLPYGKPELVMTLKPRGAALGFSLDAVGSQIRAAFEGVVPHRFARGDDEVAIRVDQVMREEGTAALRSMQLKSPGGEYVPLTEIVNLRETQGFAAIQRREGKTTISVTGDIDNDVNTTDGVVEQLEARGALEAIARKYGIEYEFGGRSREQREAFQDLGVGTLVALSVVYIILAWVFGSYFRPFAVMLIIPFGVVGAVIGHWLLGYQLTILSMIGLLGLAGILVNDSIILVSRYDERLRSGEEVDEACIGASRDRLRAVLLTSLTTIGGLIPLLFEKSLQAQFLMPMAITMVFGLAMATLLVLFLVPALIGIGYDIRLALIALYGRREGQKALSAGE
ncbi:efflux RND transporter permease subunit [Oricola cellulosilytica]|uniref:Efflux RND transporter permease subunit n=1 Tax=Oricola cellulosilytica TaxID=1429082 RepID=A0A4R0PF92_9HYPH|nr:efflux RND transporter permease subunit [Oricola cellulosilytica]TCD16505.1 efflux RND transporter permease subunit [Oricola cellulosilytica]